MDEKKENLEKQETEKEEITEVLKEQKVDDKKETENISDESSKDGKTEEKPQEEVNIEEKKVTQNEIEIEQKINIEEPPKYVPYTPVSKNKKEKKNKQKVIERPDIEKEFNRIKRKRKKQIIITLVLVVILLAIGIFCTGFALLNINDTKILSGISIRNISVGGLTKEQAIETLNRTLEHEKTRVLLL